MAKQVKSVDVIEQNIFANTIKSADELISKLTALNNEFKSVAETTKEVIKASKFDSVKSLNDFTKASENSTKVLKQQLEVQKNLNEALALRASTEAKLYGTTLKNEKIETERFKRTVLENKENERQVKISEAKAKASEKEAQKQSLLSTAYGRVNKMLNNLRSEYRDLAIRKELGAKLTEKEEFRYANLEKRITTFDKALKGVDASMGLHQRNVGNYKSAYNGLGFAMAQVTREGSAFVNNAQTGFMAISNNLPMLFDELSKIKKANVELKSQGLETKSVLSQVATSLFSWQTALSVGVTLLTIYGAKLVDYVMNLNGAKDKEEAHRKELEKKHAIQKSMNEYVKKYAQTIGQESSMYVGLINALKQTNKNSQERKELIKTINEQYGTTLRNLSNETKFQDQLNKSVLEYIAQKRNEFRLKANQENIERGIAEQEKLRLEALKLRLPVEKQLLKDILDGRKLLSDISFTRILTKDEELALNRFESIAYRTKVINENLEKWGANVGKLTLKTNDFNKTNKDNATTQKDVNEYASKYLEIIAKIIALEEQRKAKSSSDELAKEVEKQLKNIRTTGDGEIQETYRIITEQNRLKQEARQAEYEANKIAREEEYKRKVREIDKDLKALKKAGKEDTDAYRQLQENKKAIKKEFDAQNKLSTLENEDAMKKITEESLKELAEINKNYTDAIIDYNKQAEEKTKKEAEDKLQQQKDTFKQLDQLAKFSADYFIKQSERKVAMIEKNIDAMQKQNDFMKDLAVSGNIVAQQSLAQNNKLIVEANKEKQKELKKQERIKLAMTVFDAYNSNLQNKEVGGQNALVKTIKDVSLLSAFINSLPAFFEGTEDTGTNGKGVDGKGGFLSVLHPNERVVPKELNNKMGGMTNLELSTLAEDYLRGNIINKYDTAINTNWNTEIIVSELRDLKSTILNKPENKVEVGEILGGVMHIVETTKTNNQRVRNIRRL